VLLRLFDKKAVALQRTGRLGTYAVSLGQEAVSVGIASAMWEEDVFRYTQAIQRTSANRFSGLAAELCSDPPDLHLSSSVQTRFGETGYDSNSLAGPEVFLPNAVAHATTKVDMPAIRFARFASAQRRCRDSHYGAGGLADYL
jgi:hypothetical protein